MTASSAAALLAISLLLAMAMANASTMAHGSGHGPLSTASAALAARSGLAAATDRRHLGRQMGNGMLAMATVARQLVALPGQPAAQGLLATSAVDGHTGGLATAGSHLLRGATGSLGGHGNFGSNRPATLLGAARISNTTTWQELPGVASRHRPVDWSNSRSRRGPLPPVASRTATGLVLGAALARR